MYAHLNVLKLDKQNENTLSAKDCSRSSYFWNTMSPPFSSVRLIDKPETKKDHKFRNFLFRNKDSLVNSWWYFKSWVSKSSMEVLVLGREIDYLWSSYSFCKNKMEVLVIGHEIDFLWSLYSIYLILCLPSCPLSSMIG